MTSTAFLSGRLPSGEANGLAAIVRELVDDPGAVHVLVVLADCVKVTQLVESGSTVPTIRVRRVEAISDSGDRAQLQRLLMREYERRTGQPTLPIELETDIEKAFGVVLAEQAADQPTPDGPPDPPADDPPPAPRRRKKT